MLLEKRPINFPLLFEKLSFIEILNEYDVGFCYTFEFTVSDILFFNFFIEESNSIKEYSILNKIIMKLSLYGNKYNTKLEIKII
jgi:hypothetical protein